MVGDTVHLLFTSYIDGSDYDNGRACASGPSMNELTPSSQTADSNLILPGYSGHTAFQHNCNCYAKSFTPSFENYPAASPDGEVMRCRKSNKLIMQYVKYINQGSDVWVVLTSERSVIVVTFRRIS